MNNIADYLLTAPNEPELFVVSKIILLLLIPFSYISLYLALIIFNRSVSYT